MIPYIHGRSAGGCRNDANQARCNRDLDVDLERQRKEVNEEEAPPDPKIGTCEARQERRDGQEQQHVDRRHAGRLDARPINLFPRLLMLDKKSGQGFAKLAFGLCRVARISHTSPWLASPGSSSPFMTRFKSNGARGTMRPLALIRSHV